MSTMSKRTMAFVLVVVIASSGLTAGLSILWLTKRAPAPVVVADPALSAQIDSLMRLIADSTFASSVPAADSLSASVQAVIDQLQREHRRLRDAILLSTAQRSRDLAEIEHLARLATCNTSGLVEGGRPNRYSYCRGIQVSMLGGAVVAIP